MHRRVELLAEGDHEGDVMAGDEAPDRPARNRRLRHAETCRDSVLPAKLRDQLGDVIVAGRPAALSFHIRQYLEKLFLTGRVPCNLPSCPAA